MEEDSRVEVRIEIADKNYVDSLIVALVRQGYEVYLSYDKDAVCYMIDKEELNL